MYFRERFDRLVHQVVPYALLLSLGYLAALPTTERVLGEELVAVKNAPRPSPAFFETFHVVKLPEKKFGGGRGIPGDIVVLKDGRLLLSYMEPLSYGIYGSIQGRISKDKGRTWGPEFTLVQKAEGDSSYDTPDFLRLANGQILLSYIFRNFSGTSGSRPYFGHNYYRRSTDEGQTWSEQRIVTPYPGYNLIHNDKLVQLSSGRVIAPVEHELQEEGGDHRGYISYVFYSDDHGRTWQKSKNMVNTLPIDAQEPHVVELKDGRLMMLCRTYSGFVVRAYSGDQGVRWSQGEPVRELKLSPNSSALNVKRIPTTEDLLLLRSSGGQERRRTPFVSAISQDEGKTWIQERVIRGDPKDDYGYPSLLFLDDLAIISFHQEDGLHVARIAIDWFYGK